jgi:ribose transport system ATP-binding protein
MCANPATTDSNVVLEARGITKSFPGVKALDGVDILVRRGRLNALLGENGAGKSTLMNVLAGVFPPDDGEILLEGKQVQLRTPREAQGAGISIIFQELNLIPQLSIAENVFLGREPRNRLGLIDYGNMDRDARLLLEELDLPVDPRKPVGELRVGAQQVVEIAKALSFRSRILIMDEPTSAITEQEVEVLFRLIRRLKARGVGIVYITHKLDELKEHADDVTVLRDGQLIAGMPYGETTRSDIVRMMVGRELSDLFPKSAATLGDEVLRVDRLSLRHPERAGDFVFNDVSFSLRRGEVLGLFGLMGAGRTELLQTIFGLHSHASSGEIRVDGRGVKIRSPRAAIATGLALAPEDRKMDGLVMTMNVAENISLCSLGNSERFGLLARRRESDFVGQFVRLLGIKTSSLSQLVRNLSGGNQQKVVLSKWLATRPKVLLLDEPTRGIDIGAKKEIYKIIEKATELGLAVVMVSSELPEILAIADRILVMCEGRLTAEFTRGKATEENIMRAALPVAASPRSAVA